MKCPVDNTKLKKHLLILMGEEVEIDKCMKCGGVWYDKGEVEKVVDALARLKIHRMVEE